jgi:hypothetical protein
MVYAESGELFRHAVKRVQDTMKPSENYLDLVFNEIRIRVSHDSNIDDLCTIYDLKHELNRMEMKNKFG